VSSATDINLKDGAGAAGKDMPKTRRPNPVALEVPVSVAGARPTTAEDKRELFTEETTTVLVFKDGAVIQLSAAIAVGQLLFLTDKRSKREVVCQVVHKRSHRPMSCYVELEFTEDVKNFWGVTFPQEGESQEVPPTAEALEAAETTEDDTNERQSSPKSEDVAKLKQEVEALRAQLRELKEMKGKEEKPAEDDAEEQARKLAEAELAARAAAENEAKERSARLEREARARAERMAAEGRQMAQQLEGEAKQLAEEEAAARAAAENEAKERSERGEREGWEKSQRMAREAEEKAWAKSEEERKASEEARRWEEAAIEAERRRKLEERERREREEAERAKPEGEKQEAPATPEATAMPKIGMRLPSAAALAHTETSASGAVTPEPAKAAPPANSGNGATDPLEELLPKPALDFSRARKGLDPNDPYNIYKPLRKKAGWSEIIAAGIVVILLVSGGALAWYNNWLPFLHRIAPEMPTLPKSEPVAKHPIFTNGAKAPVANVAKPQGENQEHDTHVGTSTPNSSAAGPGTAATPAATTGESKPEAHGAGEGETHVEAKTPVTKPEEPAKERKSEAPAKASIKKPGKNHGKAETSSESKPKEEEVVPSDAPVIPAKLLAPVSPVYPPDAMRSYITGDVRIEAEVDAKGHVGAMRVLFGPEALRQAAKDALKQYEYAPATQGGKPVASRVVVTVKFWFDP